MRYAHAACMGATRTAETLFGIGIGIGIGIHQVNYT